MLLEKIPDGFFLSGGCLAETFLCKIRLEGLATFRCKAGSINECLPAAWRTHVDVFTTEEVDVVCTCFVINGPFLIIQIDLDRFHIVWSQGVTLQFVDVNRETKTA